MSHRKLRSALYLTMLSAFASLPLAAQETMIQPRQQATAVTNIDHRVPDGYFIETEIQCPGNMMIRVSGPPGGWEPSVTNVRSENARATIEQVGGETRLTCRYVEDEAYFYYRSPPADETRCRLISETVFGCRRPGDWINNVGSAALTGQINFDNTFDPVAPDFRVVAVAEEDERYLSGLREGSKSLATAAGTELSIRGCQSRLTGSGRPRVPLSSFTPGSRWCFETTSGRIGWFEVTSRNRGVSRVDFTTWAK